MIIILHYFNYNFGMKQKQLSDKAILFNSFKGSFLQWCLFWAMLTNLNKIDVFQIDKTNILENLMKQLVCLCVLMKLIHIFHWKTFSYIQSMDVLKTNLNL